MKVLRSVPKGDRAVVATMGSTAMGLSNYGADTDLCGEQCPSTSTSLSCHVKNAGTLEFLASFEEKLKAAQIAIEIKNISSARVPIVSFLEPHALFKVAL